MDEAADAASQSLARLLLNEKLTEGQTRLLLEGLDPIVSTLDLDQLANPNISPETLVQVLTFVAPVMSEWQKLSFSTNFELLRRVVGRLNKISEQLDVLEKSGQEAADERYELTYRDYLMQRFHRVEAGTVKMTTSLDVYLREHFVMPRILPRKRTDEQKEESTLELMDLRAASKRFQEDPPWGRIETIERTEEPKGGSALAAAAG